MHVADLLKDKVRRWKGRQQLDQTRVNGTGKPKVLTSTAPGESSEKTVLREPSGVSETMERSLETARSTLDRHMQLQQASTNYSESKTALLTTEQDPAWSWDGPAKQRASQTEKQANEILIKIREHERDDPGLFGNLASEAVPSASTRDMGGRFLVNKPRIEQSKIFAIASEMPKGAHLHLHFNAELPPEKLFIHARKPEMEDTMCIGSTQPLVSNADFQEAEIVFNVISSDVEKVDLFSPTYQPNLKDEKSASWMRWVDFRQRFPPNVPMENTAGDSVDLVDAAEYWAREKMIVTIDNAYSEHQTLNGAWACFNQGTRAFKGLVNYEGVYRWYVGAAIDSMVRDKVMYAELRPMLMDKTIPSNDGRRKLDHSEQMAIIQDEINRKREELRKKNQLHLFPFGFRIIYCAPRSIKRERMQGELQDCLKLKLQFPDLICGFDLVGAEDRPNHIGFYADLLVAFANTCKELDLDIPFMFHAGESLLDTGGSHNPDNSNLYDSLLLDAKRIGHGYSILKHPLLVEKYKEKKICLELCPISNELLHLCGNIRQHIFPELLAAGLQCTLNGDNPSLYRGPGRESASLSHEFCQVLMGDPRMNIHGWKQLAEWSIEHARLTDTQKAEAKRTYSQQWEAFCQWIVDQYGEIARSLPDLVNPAPA